MRHVDSVASMCYGMMIKNSLERRKNMKVIIVKTKTILKPEAIAKLEELMAISLDRGLIVLDGNYEYEVVELDKMYYDSSKLLRSLEIFPDKGLESVAGKWIWNFPSDLKSGDPYSCILYKGPSVVEAKATYDFLDKNKKNETPIMLGDTEFGVLITDLNMLENYLTTFDGHDYSVSFSGVLV